MTGTFLEEAGSAQLPGQSTAAGDGAWAIEYFAATGGPLSPSEAESIPELTASVLAVTARLRDVVPAELPFTPIYSASERDA